MNMPSSLSLCVVSWFTLLHYILLLAHIQQVNLAVFLQEREEKTGIEWQWKWEMGTCERRKFWREGDWLTYRFMVATARTGEKNSVTNNEI